MSLADIISRFLLSYGHQTTILPIIIIGYTIFNRRRWGLALYIMLFTMIFSKFLKNIWQIPLPAHIDPEGYAFPSGHMQATVAFYGWVMIDCRKRIVTLICLCIMAGVAYGLLHFGYHIPRDIFGAIGFGVLSLGVYYYIINKFFVRNPEKIGFLLALISYGLIYIIPPITFLWLPLGALVGFAIGWSTAKSAPMPHKLWHKILALVISVAGVGAIKFGADFVAAHSALGVFITYLLTGIWIAGVPKFVSSIKI